VGYDGYGRWHLGIEEGASEETKGRFGFPFGDFKTVNRAVLIHASSGRHRTGTPKLKNPPMIFYSDSTTRALYPTALTSSAV
jgi:hypothetical protein